MPFLNTETFDVYEEIINGELCGYDQYNKAKKCPNFVCTVTGSLAMKRPLYSNTARGPIEETKYLAELPNTIDVTRLDRIRIAGYPNWFTVTAFKIRRMFPGYIVELTEETT
jgi:hypothetical protein